MESFHVFGLALSTSLIGYGEGAGRFPHLVVGIAGTAWFVARLAGWL